jgi:hypothetical protein
MASNGKDPSKKNSTPKGVRGPSGPQAGQPTPRPTSTSPGGRGTFERISLPILAKLHSMPRWLIVVLPAIGLFGGLLLRDSWAWLGGILLTVVWVFLAWLTALSWPALTPGSRFFRALIVVFFGGIVVLKFMGNF